MLVETNCLGPGMVVTSAKGTWLTVHNRELRSNKLLLDCTSAYASVNFGHRNEAIASTLPDVDISSFMYPDGAHQVASFLENATPNGTQTIFQVGGAQAVSLSLSLALARRPGAIGYIDGSFHGLTYEALSCSSVQAHRSLQATFAECTSGTSFREFVKIPPGEVPDDLHRFSAVICEPVQGANGYVPLDREWLTALSTRCKEEGVGLICDEIQCGFYRHGEICLSTAWGLKPDAVLFGKSLTNGSYPLSAVVLNESFKLAAPSVEHTFQTGGLGFHAACGVINFLQSNPVREWCHAIEDLLGQFVRNNNRAIIAPHVTGPTLSFEPTSLSAKDVVKAAFNDGLLIFRGGSKDQRIRFAPPLTTSIDDLKLKLSSLSNILGH